MAPILPHPSYPPPTLGFEFEVRGQWLRLQGAGGLYGDAILCAYDDLSPARQALVRDRLLARVRAEAHRTGRVRRWTDHEDHRQRIRAVPCAPSDVTGIRERRV